MAIKFSYSFKGLTLEECYAKVQSFRLYNVGAKYISVEVAFYATEMARNTDVNNFLNSESFIIPFTNECSLTYVYEELMKLDYFKGAISV